MNKKIKYYIHSAGLNIDYNWKDNENKIYTKIENVYNEIRNFLYEESPSFVIFYDNKMETFGIFITYFDSNKKDRSKRKIIVDIIIESEDESTIRKIAIYYLKKQNDFGTNLINTLSFSDDFRVEGNFEDFIQEILKEEYLISSKNIKEINENDRFLFREEIDKVNKMIDSLQKIRELPKENTRRAIKKTNSYLPIVVFTNTVGSDKLMKDGNWIFITDNNDSKMKNQKDDIFSEIFNKTGEFFNQKKNF